MNLPLFRSQRPTLVMVAIVMGIAVMNPACEAAPSDEPTEQPNERPDEEPDPDPDPTPYGGTPDPLKAQRFFLPMGEPTNTAAPRIILGPNDSVHAVYPRFAGGGVLYALCTGGCDSDSQFTPVRFDTEGSVENAMIALDGQKPRILASTLNAIYYGSCEADCGNSAAWRFSKVMAHDGFRDVTGEAFALDPSGRPRFVMHTEIAWLGWGQRPPATEWVMCDADCHEASSWRTLRIAEQIWSYASLAFTTDGKPQMAMVAHILGDHTTSTTDMAAWVGCESDCDQDPQRWRGTMIMPAYVNDLAAVSIRPSVALALTAAQTPMVAFLGTDAQNRRLVTLVECGERCDDPDQWLGSVIIQSEKLGAGVDLAIDPKGRPHVTYTWDYMIAVALCAGGCAAENTSWSHFKVEAGHEMDPDEVFIWENCEVNAWFLHSPSIAIASSGRPLIGYQARDIRASTGDPHDPTEPRCPAGTDMSWSRMTAYR